MQKPSYFSSSIALWSLFVTACSASPTALSPKKIVVSGTHGSSQEPLAKVESTDSTAKTTSDQAANTHPSPRNFGTTFSAPMSIPTNIAALLNSKHPNFPLTQNSPADYIDSLDFVAPCRTPGCSVARTGGHNLHWYVTQSQSESGRAYYVKGEDDRCWERLEWDGKSIKISYDNCWWTPGYKYSRYQDGSWLARIWKPGDSIVADHTVYGGNWDSCTDVPIGQGLKRHMTFLWRVKDFDWGPAGKLDTIAIRQSYPHQPSIREHYLYARGYGLIAWNYENDLNPAEFNSNVFNLQSQVKPIPQGTKCVAVESVDSQQPTPLPIATPTPKAEVTPTPAPVVTPIPTPQSLCTVRSLHRGFVFTQNQPVYSCSQKYSLVFQSDGNLVLYNTINKAALWSTSTGQSQANVASFQIDGNLVVYRNGTPLWDSKTGGRGAELYVQDDGNLVIHDQSGKPIWASGTEGK